MNRSIFVHNKVLFLQNKQEKYEKQAEIFAKIPILQLSSPGCSRFKHPDVPVPDIRVSAYNLY